MCAGASLAGELDLPALHSTKATLPLLSLFLDSGKVATPSVPCLTRQDQQWRVTRELPLATKVVRRANESDYCSIPCVSAADTTPEAMEGACSDSTPLYANDKISRTDVTFCFTPSAMIAKYQRHCLSTPMSSLLRGRHFGMAAPTLHVAMILRCWPPAFLQQSCSPSVGS